MSIIGGPATPATTSSGGSGAPTSARAYRKLLTMPEKLSVIVPSRSNNSAVRGSRGSAGEVTAPS
ncbi:Uncharacterised protein [Mycobacteroides abscessus subsp. abscessus]|nr:Uncharacterised protein [Mycobacteroides abscessus subsp. abscessus]